MCENSENMELGTEYTTPPRVHVTRLWHVGNPCAEGKTVVSTGGFDQSLFFLEAHSAQITDVLTRLLTRRTINFKPSWNLRIACIRHRRA